MREVRLSDAGIEAAALEAAEVLRAGGVVLYPTDTLYGLGADAFSDKAIAKIYAIKKREIGKPVHCVVADMEMAEEYADVTDEARLLAKEFLPGPLTLVLGKKAGVGTGIARDIETIGIRIPDNEFCSRLAREFGKPYTTTSANVSGKEMGRDVRSIVRQFGKAADDIDLLVDAGVLPERRASTVVGLGGIRPIIIREGAIPAAEIWDCLGIPGPETAG